ncbi:MAG: hypothetical protein GYA17_07910 [Chloroflexi bacterium]|nr:formyltransferase family protein [Anaerolineaceae bacterium]NMB88271.1 hypothetical protein [Chloroflexota bacterium]
MSILFLGKQRDDFYTHKAIEFTHQIETDAQVVLGKPGESLPEAVYQREYDYIISYLSPWIVPQALLERARLAAVNFHPAPPEYPGTGCTNFAIYHGVKTYGVTCHHMLSRVDTGNIIAVRRFPVLASDTVYSLTQRCYVYLLALYIDLFSEVANGESLPVSSENWTRKPYRRVEFEALKKIELDMDPEEIRRRVKATTFPGYPGAYVEVGGVRFEYVDRSEP